MKNKIVNRRDFLRLSAAVGAGSFLSSGFATSNLNATTIRQATEIPMRTLGRTGLKVPILGMGVDRPDSQNVIRAAYNSGIRFFDTAHAYQNGRNEESLGELFKGKPRDSFCIATKNLFNYSIESNFEETLNKDLEVSLKRLKVDYVDIFCIHSAQKKEQLTNDRMISALKKIKSEGKVRFVGFSSHVQDPEVLDAAIEAGIYDVALLSYNFKIKNLKEMDAAIERAAKAGIGIVGMKAMAGGSEDAEGKKKVNARACLKWVWKNKNISTVIPGFFNYDQLEDCIAAALDPELTPDEQKYLAALQGQEMLYCQQCGACRSQCPQELPIPDIMRAYMYNYGYKHPRLSKETLSSLNLSQDTCANCRECLVECTSGFDIKKKVTMILPIIQVSDEFLG